MNISNFFECVGKDPVMRGVGFGRTSDDGGLEAVVYYQPRDKTTRLSFEDIESNAWWYLKRQIEGR